MTKNFVAHRLVIDLSMTNQLITYRLPIDYSLISLMSLISSISYVWTYVPIKSKLQHPPALGLPQAFYAFSCPGGRAFDHHS